MGVIPEPGSDGESSVDPEKEARRAFERGMKALNRRPYTEAGMTDLLSEVGFSEPAVEAAVTELLEIEAIDDVAYAAAYANEKREFAGWGSQRIAESLRRKGVRQQEIANVLAADSHENQLERAVEQLGKRGQIPTDDRERNRALAFLTRRGYDLEIAYEAIRRYEKS